MRTPYGSPEKPIAASRLEPTPVIFIHHAAPLDRQHHLLLFDRSKFSTDTAEGSRALELLTPGNILGYMRAGDGTLLLHHEDDSIDIPTAKLILAAAHNHALERHNKPVLEKMDLWRSSCVVSDATHLPPVKQHVFLHLSNSRRL